jgi:putative ABC transport system substrate-binding protein
MLGDDSNPSYAVAVRDAQAAAPSLGLALIVLTARSGADIDRIFADAIAQHARAVVVQPSTLFFGERRRIVELAARHRLPAAYAQREYADAGGLVAYGTNLPELFVRAAPYVAKILGGSKPGDLPIEQPTRFEMVVNLKTAKALGLTIPSAVLARADHVIE